MLINFHLTSKESRAQSNLFFKSISVALAEESIQKKRKGRKSQFLFTAQLSRKTNLAEIFSESRSGTMAHKNKKRITAVTHCGVSLFSGVYILPIFPLIKDHILPPFSGLSPFFNILTGVILN